MIFHLPENQIQKENIQFAKERLWLLILSVVLIIATFLLYLVVTQRNKNKELQFIQTQQETNEEIYNLMLSQNENQSILIHDIKKHLQSIKLLNEKNDSEELLKPAYHAQIQKS